MNQRAGGPPTRRPVSFAPGDAQIAHNEEDGMEDPRVTLAEGVYYITYSTYSRPPCSIAKKIKKLSKNLVDPSYT